MQTYNAAHLQITATSLSTCEMLQAAAIWLSVAVLHRQRLSSGSVEQVYAPTIPGFGRSEKPALAYSQTLWLDFLREFVIEVVHRPVVVVGNSIGGFISATLAAAAPAIVKGHSSLPDDGHLPAAGLRLLVKQLQPEEMREAQG